ncbi:hypothetical protein [Sphingobacterium siyangense]|uniref:hypothetical protein n=1 Tax=Sphingobacterium siyangense TaxID=459529 RepID=UPI0019657BF2|nr:hypothetical protein [Sphingobacterium siyangense]QRY57159.1 hypothetical protein JVX97_24725 [Sphingobacterium siyangense]
MKTILFPLLMVLLTFVSKAQTPVQITTIPGNTFVYVGSLERADNDVSNSQKIIIKIWGGSWFSDSNGETSFYISNRNGLNVVQTNVGPYSDKKISLKAYKNGTKTDFYIVPNPNEYTSFAVNSFSYGHTLDSKFVQITSQVSAPALPEVSFAIIPTLMTDGSGNVGIGAPASPGQKLSVNGSIRAREIKVETANWPDYVFKQDYRLLSLEEVDEFIQRNNHLPDVPKAEVVEKEGYSLNEMDKILLKKIEEMTLQLIQLNETVKKQAVEIDKLRGR